MTDFRSVISMWPTRAELAREIGTEQGVVQQWWNRARIPPNWYDRIERAARQRGLRGVTQEKLLAAYMKSKPPLTKAS